MGAEQQGGVGAGAATTSPRHVSQADRRGATPHHLRKIGGAVMAGRQAAVLQLGRLAGGGGI